MGPEMEVVVDWTPVGREGNEGSVYVVVVVVGSVDGEGG